MERRTFLKFLAVAWSVGMDATPVVSQPPLAAAGIQASNLEAQQRQWSETHGG